MYERHVLWRAVTVPQESEASGTLSQYKPLLPGGMQPPLPEKHVTVDKLQKSLEKSL
ncbi:hypothetical protein RIEGSTA812A_PEG_1111 [invertebrate metagenome]|uniref:Uncharacterized protein n=1 Tax=invertebrate metagenome TaxID=1711999 RepID=A0A484HBV8_9ZZZZ